MSQIAPSLSDLCERPVVELRRHERAERHILVIQETDMMRMLSAVAERNRKAVIETPTAPAPYYLATLLLNDERFLEDNCFKLYLVLSEISGDLLIIEHPLASEERCPSFAEYLPTARPLEYEIQAFFDIPCGELDLDGSDVLPPPLPKNLAPLRASRPLEELLVRLAQKSRSRSLPSPPDEHRYLHVGPIHKDLVESGTLRLLLAGEEVEDVKIIGSNKHRGIEKLFETNKNLENGVSLASLVVGDASFAHALAYCRAVESLVGIRPPEVGLVWRGLLLEIERIASHMLFIEKMLHDIGFDLLATGVAGAREQVMRINYDLTGSRLLHGICRPGGVVFPTGHPGHVPIEGLKASVAQCYSYCQQAFKNRACLDRLQEIGTLSIEDARRHGATGLILRASGVTCHDFRLRHADRGERVLDDAYARLTEESTTTHGDSLLPDATAQLRGDVYDRFLIRVREVLASLDLVGLLAQSLRGRAGDLAMRDLRHVFQQTPSFEFGVGFAESHHGDICYWVMRGPNNTIKRCKVRDPALYNREALRVTLLHQKLADVPLIYSSWGWSFAACNG